MNIAFVASLSPLIIDRVYLRYVAETSESLLHLGHRVVVFLVGEKDGADLDLMPDGLERIEVDEQISDRASRYYDPRQATSDYLTDTILNYLDRESGASFDVIEMPLWNGIGFSLIRAKRLLNACSDSKLVVNALFGSVALKEGLSDVFAEMIQVEMENYSVRYADIVSTPFEKMSDCLRLKCGRSDVQLYEAESILEHASRWDVCESAIEREFHAFIEEDQASQPVIGRLDVFELVGKRRYQRAFKPTPVAVVIRFEGTVAFEALNSEFLNLNAQGVALRKIVYCDSSDEAIRYAFDSLDLAGQGHKLPLHEESAFFPTLMEVLATDEGAPYVVFARNNVGFEENYLLHSIYALERNSEIAVIGAYASGSLLRYPFSVIPGLIVALNTCSPWGMVFRVSKLEQLLGNALELDLKRDDWDLLLALVQQYQTVDILPLTYLKYSRSQDGYAALDERSRILKLLETYPRCWTGIASRLVKLLVSNPDKLSLGGDVIIGAGNPKISLAITGLPGVPELEPESICESAVGDTPNVPNEDPDPDDIQSIFTSETESCAGDCDCSSSSESSETQASIATQLNNGEPSANGVAEEDEQDSTLAENEIEPQLDSENDLTAKNVADEIAVLDGSPVGIDLNDKIAASEAIRTYDEDAEAAEWGNPMDEPLILPKHEVHTDPPTDTHFVGEFDVLQDGNDDDDSWAPVFAEEVEAPNLENETSELDVISIASSELDADPQTQDPEASAPEIDPHGGLRLKEVDVVDPGPVFDGSDPVIAVNQGESIVGGGDGDCVEGPSTSADTDTIADAVREECEDLDTDPLDCFQVFWTTGTEFNENDSVLQYYDSSSTQALEITVESGKPIQQIRLDPSKRKGQLALRRIEIWSNKTHMPIFLSSEQNAFDNIIPCGDFEVEGIEADSLLLDAIGTDPQVILSIDQTDDSSNIMISIEFSFRRSDG